MPVGLVLANKGGTRVESWLDRDYLQTHTQEPLDSMAIVKRFGYDYHRPLLWGNGTFAPILNYTVKGILYYQGCSNVGDPAGQYTRRLKDLVAQWRRDFGLGQLPFYFVQIAPYWYDNRDTRRRSSSPTAAWSAPTTWSIRTRSSRFIPPRSGRWASGWPSRPSTRPTACGRYGAKVPPSRT